LQIEPSAIPSALVAFRAAHDRVLRKVKELNGLEIKPWAGDEVSRETAVRFEERSLGGGAESAIACLVGYELQLRRAVESLEAAQADYIAIEGDNSALWGTHHS
jgi:hypothetical protein